MKKLFTFLYLLFALATRGWAQASDSLQVSATIYLGLSYAQPVGEFKSTYPKGQAIGPTFGLLVKPNPNFRYLQVGAEVSYLADGIRTIDVPNFNAYTLKTAHSFIPIHAVVRLKPEKYKSVVPYLDGLAGITIFNTRTKVKQDVFTWFRKGEEAEVLNKQNTTVFNYGLAAGLHFGNPRKKGWRADLRLVYLQSPIARYVKPDGIIITNDGYPNYKFSYSETSMFLLQFNVAGLIYSSYQ
jgi:hypothetical protein